MTSADDTELERWHRLDAAAVLSKFADHAAVDPTFKPARNARTERWYATVAGNEYEILVTGPKFWDARAERGGGGALDLIMHLHQIPFKKAVQRLREAGL